MPVSRPFSISAASSRPDHPRDPKPFGGWALAKAATLDAAGARGLVADLLTASTLRRQAAFVVLATVPIDEPRPFLERLGEPNACLGDVIRFRRARDLIAAAFETMPESVPSGFERTLTRVGDDPLRREYHYRRLFEIISQEPHGPKAHALRYCGPITSSTIEALDLIDPILLDPEIIRSIRAPSRARHANRVLRFLQSVCSTATPEALHKAARQAVAGSGLEKLARCWVERADIFPPPPFPASPGVTPLTSAAQMIAAGREFNNCLKTSSKIAEVLLGYAYHYVIEHRAEEDAEPSRYVVEVTPLSNGGWVIGTIEAIKRGSIPDAAKAAVLARMLELGALAPTNPARYPEARALGATLGVYRYDLPDFLHPDAEADAAA